VKGIRLVFYTRRMHDDIQLFHQQVFLLLLFIYFEFKETWRR